MAAIFPSAHVNSVNRLVLILVEFRLLFLIIYYGGVSKVADGIRTLNFVGGLLSNITLIIVVLVSIL